MRINAMIYFFLIVILLTFGINMAFSDSGISYEFTLAKPSINYKKALTSIAFNQDSSIISAGSVDGNVKLWQTDSKKEIKTIIRNPHPVTCIEFSPDGNIIAVGLESGAIALWDINYKERIRTLKGHDSKLRSLKFNKDGTILFSAGDDKKIKMWDMKSGNELKLFSGHTDAVYSIDYSSDNILVSGSRDGSIKVWDSNSGNNILTIKADSASVNSVSISPDGKSIASGMLSGLVKIYDMASGEEKATLSGQKNAITINDGVKFAPDGNIIISSSNNGSIMIWDLDTGKIISELKQHKNAINSIILSHDGKTLASAGEDGNINIWKIKVTEVLNITLKSSYTEWQRGILGLEAEVTGIAGKVIFQYSQDGNNWNNIFEDNEPPYSVEWDTRTIISEVLKDVQLRVIAEKSSGMSAMNISKQSFSIDNQAPTTSHDYDGKWHKEDFTINLTSSDGNGSGLADIFYRINYGPRRNIKLDGQPKITTQGINTLEYWGVDRVNNEEEHKILTDIKLDKTPPIFTDWRKEPQVIQKTHSGNFRVIVRVIDENGSGLEGKIPQLDYRIGSDSIYVGYKNMTSIGDDVWYFDIPETLAGWGQLVNQSLFYKVRCQDVAGNIGESVEQQEIIGSTKVPPTIKITYKFKNWESEKLLITTETADSDGSIAKVKFYYSLDGIKWVSFGEAKETPYSVELDTKSFAPEIAKDVRIQVYAIDNDGLIANDISPIFSIDNQPPTTTDDYNQKWFKADFNINLKSDDGAGSGISNIMYKINDGFERNVKSDGQPKINNQGLSTLEYWGVDVAGNEEEHKRLSDIKLDRFAPTIEGWNIKIDGKTISVQVKVTDEHSGVDGIPEFDYRIGKDTQFIGYKEMTKGNDGTWTYKIPIESSYIDETIFCKVSAKDVAGNLSIKSWDSLISFESSPISIAESKTTLDVIQSKATVSKDDVSIIAESSSKIEPKGEENSIIWLGEKPTSAKVGDKLNFKGRIEAKMTMPEQVNVTLIAPGDVVYMSQTYTDKNGEFTFDVTMDVGGEWRIYTSWDGNNKYRPSMSDTIRIKVDSGEIKAETNAKNFSFINKKSIIIGVLAIYLVIIAVSR